MSLSDAELELAFSVQRNPGAYVLLVGAGASKSSGVPSAWDVQNALVRQIAAIDGTTPEDESAWYVERFGEEPRYDALLAKLAKSRSERQALLRSFFEPSGEERERNEKRPTVGHRSIARLVASGRIRIVVTLNFDHLIEEALRDEGIEPTVVSSTDDFMSINPLHSQQAIVIHLHGEYLNPQSMLNTPEELGGYPAATFDLVRQIASEYGLILAGWSAAWDPALRNLLETTPNKFFSTWWIDIAPLGSAGVQLQSHRRISFIQDTTDHALGYLADATDAIADTDARHPRSRALAVASAKRALRGSTRAIPLHDELKNEATRLQENDLLQNPQLDVYDDGEVGRRLAVFDEATTVLAALTATCAYWGNAESDRWWISEIQHLAGVSAQNGLVSLINLQRYPATKLLYAGGVAAAAAGRFDLVRTLLTGVVVPDRSEGTSVAGAALAVSQTVPGVSPSRQLYESLSDLFVADLSLGQTGFDEAWEWFEYLQIISFSYLELSRGDSLEKLRPLVVESWKANPGGPTYMSRGSDPTEQQLRRELQNHHGWMWHVPHLRSQGYSAHYAPRISASLRRELLNQGEQHPLIQAGFCASDIDALKVVITVVDEDLSKAAQNDSGRFRTNGRIRSPSMNAFWIDDF